MGETGILEPQSRTELLDGVIYDMAPIGPPHGWNNNDWTHWFIRGLAGRAYVTTQTPLALAGDSEPVPDLMVVRSGADRRAHPRPVDVLLIVEVTHTTVAHHLQAKALRYGQAAIPEYWVHLVEGPQLVVHRNPSPDGYRLIQRFAPGEPVSPLAFPDLTFDLAELNA